MIPSPTPPPTFETFGARLRYWRIQRGFKKQGDLAMLLKISQGSLSDLESDNIGPSADTLLKLADALRLRPKYLLRGEGAAEGQYFQELNGHEAQLVMMFRELPGDGWRDGVLIDVNDTLNRARGGLPTQANPYPTAPPAEYAQSLQDVVNAARAPSVAKRKKG